VHWTTAVFLLSVLADIFRGVLNRLVHGPAVPTWGWSVELRVIAMRAFFRERAEDSLRTRRLLEQRIDSPVPKRLRGLVTVQPSGDPPGEWIRREAFSDTNVLLYLHGGGYVGGSPATHRHFTTRLTWTLQTKTFVLDYRIAPADRFPAALDDAVAAYEWLVTTTDPGSIFVSGDSAGGGLACALLLRLRDEGRPLPAGAVLFSPYTDLEHTGASVSANARTDYLPFPSGPIPSNVAYLGDHDPRDPLVSPVHGDFARIPPLLIFAGGREMILDDSTRLADKASGDGVEVSLHVEPDMMHVWPAVLPEHPATLRALAIASDFVRR
jgi:monoterpene epsilon-lactone hydrolase